MIEPGRIDDGGIGFGFIAGPLEVAMERLLVGPHVCFAGAVTGFAGDSQFTGAGVGSHGGSGGLRPRLAGGAVAVDAVVIPDLEGLRRCGIAEESVVERNPFLVGDEVAKWE